jgi:hypothetical protein
MSLYKINLELTEAIGRAASDAPWECVQYAGSQGHSCVGVAGPKLMCASVHRETGTKDAEFIAFARNNWQGMVDEIKQLRQYLSQLEREIAPLRKLNKMHGVEVPLEHCPNCQQDAPFDSRGTCILCGHTKMIG